MTATTITLERRFADAFPELGTRWQAESPPDPEVLLLNRSLAAELGLDPDWLTTPDGIALLTGTEIPAGATPIAMAYAGHQFGNYSPRLGDGRALLLGEIRTEDGRLHDLHLKGSGRTPYARGGDGLAALGPMIREYVVAEAMHALGIPTGRALAVLSTGADVMRQGPEPGGLLVRVAASHLRVGTFEYAVRLDEPDLVVRLVRHAVERHFPDVAGRPDLHEAFLDAVVESQAQLVAQWMGVGFIHGVMNTDNMAISGETIDYGPCAFMDRHDPLTVFSSIDHQGRYAYGNQPGIAVWDLARLAETLLAGIDDDPDQAVERAMVLLDSFPERHRRHWVEIMSGKLGFGSPSPDHLAPDHLAPDHLALDHLALDHLAPDRLALDHAAGRASGIDVERVGGLADRYVEAMTAAGADHTSAFRALATHLRGDTGPLEAQFGPEPLADFLPDWREALDAAGAPDPGPVADSMDRVNPVNIARNHLVEEVIEAGVSGDRAPLDRFLEALAKPYTELEDGEHFTRPAPDGFTDSFQTFCGT